MSLCHIIWYLDALEEDRKGDNKIGTTRKGIGPCYMDKAARNGIRIADLMDAEEFEAEASPPDEGEKPSD